MPPLSVMIKPASSLCNMRCKYCFYSDVSDIREVKSFGIMTAETADRLIEKALRFADGDGVSFAFQGGEPLLAGLDFFRHFTSKVKQVNVKNSPVHFSMQTNGTLLNSAWASFLHKNDFLVGLSLDGDFKRNKFRLEKNKNNAFHKILKAAQTLEKHGVPFNILTVLTGFAADNIDEIYSFFRSKGFRYLQFIPCLRPFGDESESELYMTEKQYGDFLIKTFTRYAEDYARGEYTSIRYFDNLVHLYLGNPTEQCGMCGHCMRQFVAEGNGNIYPCDFYCLDEWCLGNINDENTNFETMAQSEKARDFIAESLAVPQKCTECRFYPLCRACGCKRTRADRDYCESYKRFFTACLPLFDIFQNEKRL